MLFPHPLTPNIRTSGQKVITLSFIIKKFFSFSMYKKIKIYGFSPVHPACLSVKAL